MPELAYVNGIFSPIAEATVSIEDRGFQFADGVYEAIVAFDLTPFRLPEHLQRLHRSLKALDIDIDASRVDLESLIHEGIERAGFPQTLVYLQITRGFASRAHEYPKNMKPTIVATFKPRHPVEPSVRDRGISVVTVEDVRWSWCEVKSIALLPNVLAKNRALHKGHDDAIFVSPTDQVREATSANIFVVKDGVLLTPALSESILHGVTRSYLLECASVAEVPVVERDISVTELTTADESFISSTSVDVLPVTRVNGAAVGNGKPGPITGRLHRTFVESLPRQGNLRLSM